MFKPQMFKETDFPSSNQLEVHESDLIENSLFSAAPITIKKRTNLKHCLQLLMQKKDFMFFLLMERIILLLEKDKAKVIKKHRRSAKHPLQKYSLFTLPQNQRRIPANESMKIDRPIP